MAYLRPIGLVDPEMLSFLMRSLSPLYQAKLLPSIEVPQNAYDKTRGQFNGSGILEALPERGDVVLGGN